MSLSFAENVIVAGIDNRLPMLDWTQYSSWASRMLLYIQGKENGKLLVDSVLNGPFKCGTVTVPETQTTPTTVRDRTYEELTDAEKILKACLLQPPALSEAVHKSPKLGRAAQVQTSTQSDSVNLSSPIPISKAFLNVQKVTKAKLETMNRVCEIVKTQLAFPCGSVVAPNSKFSAVGVDSLDRIICGYVLSIHSYKYVLLGKYEYALRCVVVHLGAFR
nr:acyl carrier protein 4, chloroplastic [Tanacetum cinerariifolium]